MLVDNTSSSISVLLFRSGLIGTLIQHLQISVAQPLLVWKDQVTQDTDDRNHGEQHPALQIIYTVKRRPNDRDGDTHKIQRSSSDRECEW